MHSGCRRERRETHSLTAHPTQPHSGGDHTTMHRFVSPGSSPSTADPGGGAGGSRAAASAAAATPGGSAEQQQQPAAPAAHSADDDVEVVDTTSAELKQSLKETQRLAKVHRVQTETRRSKPTGASAYCWKYFECYAKPQLKAYAVCKLCVDQQELERAEIKYAQSPSSFGTVVVSL